MADSPEDEVVDDLIDDLIEDEEEEEEEDEGEWTGFEVFEVLQGSRKKSAAEAAKINSQWRHSRRKQQPNRKRKKS